ncbi:MAG: outer membrane receptor protein involved in Fe transport [Candidatus Pelagisphaera sp.]|jgi:outer membrane receptor protein involved in Fe transport
MKTKPKSDYKTLFRGIPVVIALCVPSLAAQNDSSEEIVELSPFSVDAADSTGYSATSTLAGTRIKTNLKDLGASISVVTEQFMDDVGATDAQTLLSYVSNAEVGGYQGNFTGASEQSQSRYYQTEERTNPQRNQRIRGLGAADLTRGFFLTDIALDSYNTERVTVSRGPNSLLFGIGSPGGVINNSTKQAVQNSDFGEFGVRMDSFDSLRFSFDYNKSLLKDRLAIRIAALEETQKFKQRPAHEDQTRFYGDINWTVFEGNGSLTRLRVNAEDGKQSGSPIEVIPPTVAYHNWFEPISSSISQYTGGTPSASVLHPSEGGTWEFQALHDDPIGTGSNESLVGTNIHPTIFRHVGITYSTPGATSPDVGGGLGLGGYNGLIPWSTSRDTLASTGLAGTPMAIASGLPDDAPVGNIRDFHTVSPYAEGYSAGFVAPTLQNRDVFDFYNKMYSNGLDEIKREFDAINVALEQTFLDGDVGFEVAYDSQSYFTHRNFPFSGGNGTSSAGPYDIYVHNSSWLPNGQPNPNVGRAYTRVRAPQQDFSWSDRETFRFTAFAEKDFSENDGFISHLGRHRWTGLYNDYSLDTFTRRLKDQGDSDEIDMNDTQQTSGQGLRHGRRNVNIMAYTSDSLIGVQSMDDVRLQPLDFKMYNPGETYNYAWVDTTAAGDRMIHTNEVFVNRILFNENIGQTNIDAKAFAWQSYFLDDTIVALYGYREDDTESFARNTASEADVGQWTPDGRYNSDFTNLSSTPALSESGDTQTWSVIARYPEQWLGELPFDIQAHWAASENFNPIGLRNNALGVAIGQPTGSTEEYGFQISSKDSKYAVKFNWFTTQLNSVNAGVNFNLANHVYGRINAHRDGELSGVPWSEHLARLPGGASPEGHPIQSYDEWYTATLATVPQVLKDIVNPRQVDGGGSESQWVEYEWDAIPNLRSTRNQKADGFEVELVANPTPAWRLMANISNQETVFSNTAPVMAQLTLDYVAAIRASGMDDLQEDGSWQQDEEHYSVTLERSILGNIIAARALDGTLSNEQRTWRFTGVSNYTFREGAFKDFGIGGAVRWEDEAATGYVTFLDEETGAVVPDTSRPHLDDGVFSGDIWISYEKPIMDNKVRWSTQLNVRNLIGESGNLPVKTNPDGQVAVVRIPNPTTLIWSNTFRF